MLMEKRVNRYRYFLFLTGIIMGTLFVNFWGRELLSETFLFEKWYIENILYIKPVKKELFKYILNTRFKETILFVGISFVKEYYKNITYGIVIFLFGLLNGVIYSIALIKLGMSGITVYLAIFLLPIILFYTGMFMITFNRKNIRKNRFLVGVVLIIVIDTMIETYYYSEIIQKIITHII